LSKIIITDDFEKVAQEIDSDEKIFLKELKVEDVRKIKEIAYTAQKSLKTILIAAEKYPAVSQNALLKLLEEPPANVRFILLAKSKYSLLETILSRLPSEKKIFGKTVVSEKDVSSVTNDKILEFLKEDMDKEEIKALIYKIMKTVRLNEEQLEILGNSVQMLELNIDKKAVLALIMLSLKEKF